MKRGAIVGLAVGAVVVGAVAAAAWWLATRPESADAAARRYLEALESGDRGTLAAFLADDPHRDELLDVFAGARGRVSDATIADGAGADHSFRADVTLDGSPGVVHFVLADDAGSWRLSGDYLASVEVSTTIGDAVEVGGTVVPVGRVSLLPALYAVEAAPSALLDGETTVAATNEKPLVAAVEASVSPAATVAAQTQLDAYAEACAAPATAVPPNCGLRVPWGADLTTLDTLRFRIEKTPRVALSADATGFAATGGVIVATARGTSRAGGAGTFTYRTDDWALYGSVSFQGDEMVLAVR